jgi:hypothetical protein
MRSNSMRGISLSIWLNMLHDTFMFGLLRSGVDEFRRSPIPYTLECPNDICFGQ